MIPLSAPANPDLTAPRMDQRVRLTYRIETSLGADEVELPFVIGIIGDLVPQRPDADQGHIPMTFTDVDGGDADGALRELGPQLDLSVTDPLGARAVPLRARLCFRSLHDFSPDAVAGQVDALRTSLIDRALLAEARRSWAPSHTPVAVAVEAMRLTIRSLPENLRQRAAARLTTLTRLLTALADKTPEIRRWRSTPLRRLLTALVESADPVAEMTMRMAALDSILEQRVAAIRGDSGFRRLEASWRGVDFLARTVSSRQVVVRVLPVTRQRLLDDLTEQSTVERTELYRTTYAREYGILGGRPFGLLCVDMEFRLKPDDCQLLDRLAQLGSHIHAPVIANASPDLLGCKEMAALSDGRRDLADNLRRLEEYAPWAKLRGEEYSRYLALALPRVLAADIGRAPFGQGRGFLDGARAAGAAAPLWMGAIYPFAQVAARSFLRHGWAVAITGIDSGGRVEGLPAATFSTREGGRAVRPAVEVLLTEAQENLLAGAGLLPLMHCQGQPFAAFFRAQSVRAPLQTGSLRARLEERMQVRLSLLFAICRIAHYLKVLTRETVGTLAAARDLEARLNRWIAGYVAFQDDTSPETRSRRPLRHGSVRVVPQEQQPGTFNLLITIQPHFQFDELDCSISLTSRLEMGGLASEQPADPHEETAHGP